MEHHKFVVGITLGDYNGIGPEVIIKTLQDDRLYRFCTIVIYGHKSVISHYAKLQKIQNFNVQEIADVDAANPKLPNIINCWTETTNIKPGEVTIEAAQHAVKSLEHAVGDLKAGKINLLVTGPVNKSSISEVIPDFKGQTEWITAATGSANSMMFLVDSALRVGLVTNHVSIKDVSTKIDTALIVAKIEMLNQSLKKDFLVHKPRIAVLGLNPHAGDNSLIGKEEKDIIAPAVNKAKEKGIIAVGPFAADGFFGAGHYAKFDAVLAMYHDQGLVPFKTLSFGSGVNFTSGLDVVRTSPDHGTAYDIAGKDLAEPDSLRSAILSGLDILKNRAAYQEMTANPVEKVAVDKE